MDASVVKIILTAVKFDLKYKYLYNCFGCYDNFTTVAIFNVLK